MSMVPVVASVDELPAAIGYANDRPNTRWYVAKRAAALGAVGQVPAEWGGAIAAAASGGDPSTDELAALGKKGMALRNGDGSFSYPTRNRGELAKAIQAFGRARNKVAAKRYILRRARALHAADLIPDSWKPLRAASTGPDEVGLWVAQVRDLITEAGLDPDEVEANTDGFETDYREYADTPDVYARELVDADNDPGDGDSDNDDGVGDGDDSVIDEPSAPVDAPAALPASSAPLPATVQIYTAQPEQPRFDLAAITEALTAAARDAAKEAVAAALNAKRPDPEPTEPEPAPEPEPVNAAAPSPPVGDPVDIGTAKAALRDRFNAKPPAKLGKPAKRKPSVSPPAAQTPPTALMSAAQMRERIAARTG